MRIICPHCHTRYVLSDKIIDASGCKTKCAKCAHIWDVGLTLDKGKINFYSKKANFKASTKIDFLKQDQTLASNNITMDAKFSYKKHFVLFLGFFVSFSLVIGLYVKQELIVKYFPELTKIYNVFNTNTIPQGLKIENARAYIETNNQEKQLTVEGVLVNETNRTLTIPRLSFVVNSQSHEIYFLEANTQKSMF